MDNRIALQLERLYRNYLSARKTFDTIAFYELSHTLRIWTEIADNKEALGDWYNKPVFKSARPTRKMAKLLARQEYEYIWLYTAYFNHSEIFQASLFVPTDFKIESTIISVGSQIYRGQNSSLVGLRGYYLGSQIEGLSITNIDLSNKLSLTQFLGAEIISVRYNGVKERFNAKYLIKRAANELTDSSHFQQSSEVTSERLTSVIPILKVARIANVSFLYYFLLYISQEILIAFNKIERIPILNKKLENIK